MTNERKVKGLLGTKLGMTQLWDENNRIVPVTVIQAGPCVVTQVRWQHGDDFRQRVARRRAELRIGALRHPARAEHQRLDLVF